MFVYMGTDSAFYKMTDSLKGAFSSTEKSAFEQKMT